MIDLYLFDKNKEVIGIVPSKNLISYDQTQELNNLITASFETVYFEKLEEALYFGSKDIEDESIFWRYKIVNFSKNSDNKTFSVEGIFELFDDLKNRKIFKDIRPRNKSAEYALNMLLEGTTWKIGKINSNHTATSTWYYETALDAFRDFIKKWRVEFKPRITFKDGKVVDKFIDIENQISDNYGKWYEYGDKLLKVTAESNNADIATAFYIRGKGEEKFEDTGESTGGFGRRINIADVVWSKEKGDPIDKPKGQEYLEIKEATKLYGFEDGSPRFDVIILEDIEDKQELIKAGYQEALRLSRPQRQFKATITEDEFAELGEISTIIDPRLNIRYQTRTFKVKRDFLNSKIKEIEFGDRLVKSRSETITDIADKKAEQKSLETKTELAKQIGEVRQEFKNSQKSQEEIFEEIKKRASDLIKQGFGGHVKIYPDRILILADSDDEKTARKVWQWNKNGLGFSSTGVNGYYTMAWTYEGQFNTDFILADGITANKITSGTIDASKINVVNLRAESINSGVLQGDSSYYDLKNGTIKTTQSGRSNVMRHGQYFIFRGSDEILNISNYVGDGRDAYIIEGSGADSLHIGKSNRQGSYTRDYLTFNDSQNRAVLHTDFYRIVNGYSLPVPYNKAGQISVNNIPAGGSSYVDITYGFNFSSLPVVVVSVNNGSPELFPVGTSAISRSGFRIHVKNNWNRSNSITVNWIAMEMR